MSDTETRYSLGYAALGKVDQTQHVGRHRCVDGKWYYYSCLVTDEECHHIAAAYLDSAERARLATLA